MLSLASDRNRIHIHVGGGVYRYKDLPKDKLLSFMSLLVAYQMPFEQLPKCDFSEHRVARLVRSRRLQLFLRQCELAELAQVPQPHISQIERGKRIVGLRIAKRLAAALNTDYRAFL